MILATIAFVVLAVGAIWYAVASGQRAELVTQHEFDDAYDELERKGENPDAARDAAWQEFHSWQVQTEAERRSWEEPDDV